MIKDISNQRFGRLTAISPTGEKRWGVSIWLCLCDCGKEKLAAVNSLKSGLVKSCGCLAKEKNTQRMTSHGMYGTSTYKSWDAMIQRCCNKDGKNYKKYGALGISVCDDWRNSFENFLRDMGERPSGTSLDRIDGSKGYFRENCRWADSSTQTRNRACTTLNLETVEKIRVMFILGATPSRISKETGVSYSSVSTLVYTKDYWPI